MVIVVIVVAAVLVVVNDEGGGGVGGDDIMTCCSSLTVANLSVFHHGKEIFPKKKFGKKIWGGKFKNNFF